MVRFCEACGEISRWTGRFDAGSCLTPGSCFTVCSRKIRGSRTFDHRVVRKPGARRHVDIPSTTLMLLSLYVLLVGAGSSSPGSGESHLAGAILAAAADFKVVPSVLRNDTLRAHVQGPAWRRGSGRRASPSLESRTCRQMGLA